MMKLAALLVAFAACTTNSTPRVVEPVEGTSEGRLNLVAAEDLHDLEFDASICNALPTEGVCAEACDPEALQAQIPHGVCVLIVCHLTDGRTINVGGCN